MYKTEELIVLTDYSSLLKEFEDPKSRIRWGVKAQPIFNNGNYLMPLGWEKELTKAGIEFEVKEVELFIEEITE